MLAEIIEKINVQAQQCDQFSLETHSKIDNLFKKSIFPQFQISEDQIQSILEKAFPLDYFDLQNSSITLKLSSSRSLKTKSIKKKLIFSFNNKRYHCKFCGLTVCHKCIAKKRLVPGTKNEFLPICCECEQKCLQIQVNKNYLKNKLINDNIKKKLMIEKSPIEEEIKFYQMHIEQMKKQRNELAILKQIEQQKNKIEAEVQKELAIIKDLQEKIQNSKQLKIQLENYLDYTKKEIKSLKKKIKKKQQFTTKIEQQNSDFLDNQQQLNNKAKDHYHYYFNHSDFQDQNTNFNQKNIGKINQQENNRMQNQQNNYCKRCQLV